MNCKPGDLAVIVRSHAGNEGSFVTVLRPARPHEVEGWRHADEGSHWWVSTAGRALKTTFGSRWVEGSLPDAWLRPIRPGDISDEEVRDLYAPKQPEAA